MTDTLRSIVTPALTLVVSVEQALITFRAPVPIPRQPASGWLVPFRLEALENRVMLTVNAAPTFAMPSGAVSARRYA